MTPKLVNIFGFPPAARGAASRKERAREYPAPRADFPCMETRPALECRCGRIAQEHDWEFKSDGPDTNYSHIHCPDCGGVGPRAIRQCEATGNNAEVCDGECWTEEERKAELMFLERGELD